jgi:hypothetical protein
MDFVAVREIVRQCVRELGPMEDEFEFLFEPLIQPLNLPNWVKSVFGGFYAIFWLLVILGTPETSIQRLYLL